jgi:hypothetical protein
LSAPISELQPLNRTPREARAALDAFAAERGLRIASRYLENEWGEAASA